jgi:hypothetical protein
MTWRILLDEPDYNLPRKSDSEGFIFLLPWGFACQPFYR